jgi:hypothetical protein
MFMLPLILGTLLAASCPESPMENPYPGVLSPMIGHHPAWLVDGSNRRWSSAEERIKTLWVLSAKGRGALHITGRRLDGDGEAQFQNGMDATPQRTFDIGDRRRNTVTPGGATPEIMATYAFIPSYVIYPSRGCWQFIVRIGADDTRITIEIK